ncbi:MAG: UDP-glucose 4-epimerase GalE [Candidatus Nanoarchaeia archaeon]
MTKNILVTGGAGYIGSHAVRRLIEKNYNVFVLDCLEKGTHGFVPEHVTFYKGDLRDERVLNELFSKEKIDAVIHFAGYIEAGESVKDPLKYYENNVCSSINLLKYMQKHNVKKIVFSSSAAVYGNPENVPIKEEDAKVPVNPYGQTKLMVENILSDLSRQNKVEFVSLRYFNAAGAHYGLGENHEPETHLIPLLIKTALGKREGFKIYGKDYDTRDGTCERDFVHVLDLAEAHVLGLEQLFVDKKEVYYNVGSSFGYTVKEIIELVEKITEKKISAEIAKRREGDPSRLIADCRKIKEELNWRPKKDINEIIKNAYEWELKKN